MNLNELLVESKSKLIKSIQFAGDVEVLWLINQYQAPDRNKPLILVYNTILDTNKKDQISTNFSNVILVKSVVKSKIGSHNTCMMILLYEEGLKVIVTTADLTSEKWAYKIQGIWSSGILTNAQTKDSRTSFRKDLIEYLQYYNNVDINEWADLINMYDFSCLDGDTYFISSVPGSYYGDDVIKFGHFKLKQILSKNYRSNYPKPSNLIVQCSSIGKIQQHNKDDDIWLSEFKESLDTNDNPNQINDSSKFHLIYPCLYDMYKFLKAEYENENKPPHKKLMKSMKCLNKYFYRWRINVDYRIHGSPTILSYSKFSPNFDIIDWYIITSAKLSLASWGDILQNNEFKIHS